MATLFGTAAGAALGFTLDNGLNQPFGWSLLFAGIAGASVFSIVLAALTTGVGIASFTKGRLAWMSNWIHENIIDGAVDTVGETSVIAANAVYEYIDQGAIDGTVNAAGSGSSGAGEGLRRLTTGKVQQYATVMFGGATVLAGVLIFVV